MVLFGRKNKMEYETVNLAEMATQNVMVDARNLVVYSDMKEKPEFERLAIWEKDIAVRDDKALELPSGLRALIIENAAEGRNHRMYAYQAARSACIVPSCEGAGQLAWPRPLKIPKDTDRILEIGGAEVKEALGRVIEARKNSFAKEDHKQEYMVSIADLAKVGEAFRQVVELGVKSQKEKEDEKVADIAEQGTVALFGRRKQQADKKRHYQMRNGLLSKIESCLDAFFGKQ